MGFQHVLCRQRITSQRIFQRWCGKFAFVYVGVWEQGRESNKLAFCSSLKTSTLVPKAITTDSYFLTLNGPASNIYAKVI